MVPQDGLDGHSHSLYDASWYLNTNKRSSQSFLHVSLLYRNLSMGLCLRLQWLFRHLFLGTLCLCDCMALKVRSLCIHHLHFNASRCSNTNQRLLNQPNHRFLPFDPRLLGRCSSCCNGLGLALDAASSMHFWCFSLGALALSYYHHCGVD